MSGYSTDDYALLRGVLSIAKITGGVAGTYEDVGNCPRFEVQFDIEEIEHQESRTAERHVDKRVTLVKGYTINFDLDGRNLSNLAMFLKASESGAVSLLGLANMDQEYALKLVEDNKAGHNMTWNFWRTTISPDGSLALIGENDWAKMSFTAKSLADLANHADSPYLNTMLMTTTTT